MCLAAKVFVQKKPQHFVAGSSPEMSSEGNKRQLTIEGVAKVNKIVAAGVVIAICLILALLIAHSVTPSPTPEPRSILPSPSPTTTTTTNETIDDSETREYASGLRSQPPPPRRVLRRQNNPHPFMTKLVGPTPTGFSAPLPPVSFAQLSPFPPRSIQDVIKHVRSNRGGNNDDFVKRYRQSSVHPRFEEVRKKELLEADPFFGLKPQHLGDVNLLATASVRFAPPAWANLKGKNKKKDVAGEEGEESVKNEVVGDRPLLITLNVFPDLEKGKGENGSAVAAEGRRKRKGPKRMVIKLNLYREPVGGMLEEIGAGKRRKGEQKET